MRIKQSLWCSLVVLLCVFADAHAQAWSGILDPSRATNWLNNVGIPGGIPYRTSVCATITPPSGSTDATSGIQAALNSCAANRVVVLSAGTFRINGSITVPSNVTLRGAGANQTILDAHGSGNGVITFGSGPQPSAGGTSITAGATAGSTSITLSSASGISAGSYLMITELNDASFVTTGGTEGACTWCDIWNGTRSRGQIVEVQSVSSNTVRFLPALYSAYSHTPLATPVPIGAKYAGVENLQVYANNTGYTANFYMQGAAYCWIKGVEGNYADGDHVEVYSSYRGEIRDSYFSNAYVHGPGSTDADVFIVSKTTGFLVENNILERLHVSLLTNWGAAGNVFGYNYSLANFDSGGGSPLVGNFMSHGAHPQFNLWEGNVGGSYYPDSVWGSSSHNTFFRSWVIGATQYCTPTNDNGRSPVQWNSCTWSTQADVAMQIAQYSTYYNFVANVVGSPQVATAVGSEVKQAISPANRNYDGTVYDYTFGYGELADSNGNCSSSTCLPYSTAFLHGNYSNADGSTTWASGVTQTLPASFYRSAQPPFWTVNAAWPTIPWPAIGPDVTGGTGPGGHAYAIPAMACYNNTPKDSNGLLTFNASTCYVGTAPPPPAAPTNLTAVPH
jgi:hypothetical protein